MFCYSSQLNKCITHPESLCMKICSPAVIATVEMEVSTIHFYCSESHGCHVLSNST